MGNTNKTRPSKGAAKPRAQQRPARESETKPAAAPVPHRRTGLRGAAPWAARHAAKHAAEARARNASPPPPGSARATLRVPEKAEQIKAKVAELHNALVQLRALRKNLAEKFYEAGRILGTIKDGNLYEAKGYTSFEAFVERELDLGKTTPLRLERVPRVFIESAAREIGLEGLIAALEAIDNATGAPAPRPQAPAPLPLKPPAGRR
jgi:hypothetical protein